MSSVERRLTVVAVFAACVAIASIVIAVIALVEAAGPGPTSVSSPATGVYIDGPPGQPHYLVAVTSLKAGSLQGAMDYVYQDGQTSVVFTFRGSSQQLRPGSSVEVITMVPTLVPNDGSASQQHSSVPSAISVIYEPGFLNFGECGNYLHFVPSLAACQFSYLRTNEL